MSGAGFAFLSSFMVYKAADALNQSRLKFVFAVIFAACMIRQIIFLIQVLMARNVLSGEMWMDLMAPVINNSSLLIFVIFAAILVTGILTDFHAIPCGKEMRRPFKLAHTYSGCVMAVGVILYLVWHVERIKKFGTENFREDLKNVLANGQGRVDSSAKSIR